MYSDEEMKEIQYKKELQFLKPLLWNLQEEELVVSQKVKKQTDGFRCDFKSSFCIVTKNQSYKSLSIYGLMLEHSRKIKYLVINLSMLLGIWYNDNNILSKDDLLKVDLLIIQGKYDTSFLDNKNQVLYELISSRKTLHKITWIYIHGATKAEVNESYSKMVEEIKYVHQINL